ncbi:MAG: hypothetical protein AABZ45_11435 [Pseudomonadota bacterium]
MPDQQSQNDPARTRFLAISLLRLVATLLIVFGIVIAAGRIDWIDEGVALYVGIFMVGIGLFDMIVFVPMLTRRWRSGERSGD